MKKTEILIIFCAVFLMTNFVHAAEKRKYLSPNGKFFAYIIPLPKAPYGPGESKIIIKRKNGKVLCSRNYGSEDGEHGFGVEQAAWTPDSRFFVYSMSSSGGHQPWHFPTYIISVQDFKIRSFDNLLALITDPHFELSFPDLIRVTGRSIDNLEEDKEFKVKISDLIEKNGQ